jgi:predicted nucleotide-binding protein
MARRPTNPPTPEPAQLTPEQMRQAIPRLEKRLALVDALDPNVHSAEHAEQTVRPLRASIEEALVQTFGLTSIEYQRYQGAADFWWPINMFHDTSVSEIQASLRSCKTRSIDLLTAAIDALKERIEEAGGTWSTVSKIKPDLSSNRQVFIVHGHDDAAKQAVARFLEKINFDPIILSEQANQGRTIIEKFEAYSEVGFAVVLLTPDDFGGRTGGTSQLRARQNVILELGYFIGKLTRARVCALRSADVEIPSDILGVVWTPFDINGGWKTELATELEAAGYQIDWNQFMRK